MSIISMPGEEDGIGGVVAPSYSIGGVARCSSLDVSILQGLGMDWYKPVLVICGRQTF